ncbi:MAG: toxic anion resistance protein [Oscillospiraceae bacterium]|nr:toxic anion resistance protein [Oscillospiraceae bacterium]
MDEKELKKTMDELERALADETAAAVASEQPTSTAAPEEVSRPAATERMPEAAEFERMSEKEQKAIEAVSAKIDVRDAGQILQYGAAAQKGMAEFSETALASAKNRDLGEVGEMVSKLLAELKGFDAAEGKKGFLGLFKSARRSLELLRAKYERTSVTVADITAKLETHQTTLLKDIEILAQMYEKNLEYYKLLTMYILAGKMRIARDRETALASMREIARRTNLPQDAQAANDFENALQRFEKKLHDLEITRVVCIQMAPQIRLLQNNDAALADKIQSSIVNTIPLWRSQMVLSLGMQNSRAAMEAQREVTDMTNELIRKNAEMLKTGTLETAKEAERGIVDMETLKQANTELISTLDELLQIQRDGAKTRAEAETQLQLIESDLKKKLLELQS